MNRKPWSDITRMRHADAWSAERREKAAEVMRRNNAQGRLRKDNEAQPDHNAQHAGDRQ